MFYIYPDKLNSGAHMPLLIYAVEILCTGRITWREVRLWL